MITVFDVVTVIVFAGLVAAFFLWTEKQHRTLLHFGISGATLAVANQVGNAGQAILAFILIIAAIGYAFIAAWRPA